MTKFFESSQETLVEFFSTNEMPLRNIDKKLHIFSLSLSHTRARSEKRMKKGINIPIVTSHITCFFILSV